MKKILFIHSAGPQGFCEGSNFLITYLRNTIGKHYSVIAPRMPDPEEPHYTAWKNELRKTLKSLDNNSIVVGHSLGGSVLLKYLAEGKTEIGIKGIFVIAAPYWGTKDWDVDEYLINRKVFKKLSAISNIFLYHSKNDSVVPFQHLGYYADEIPNATIREIDNQGHLFSNGLPQLVEDISNIYTHD